MRVFIRILLFVSLLLKPLEAPGQVVFITGENQPSLASFDDLMTTIVTRYRFPGAQLAVSHNGRLVLAHGYGMADVENSVPVQPDSLFRIASNSKQLTAVAILQLVQLGKIGLEDSAFGYLKDLPPPSNGVVDPRIWQITIRQLLQHSGGWDRDVSSDPMFAFSIPAAQALGEDAPASSTTLIRYMMGRRLDFDPGTKFVYSNFGYCVLGRILEKVTGMPYEQYVRSTILTRLGVDDMHIGQSLLEGRAPREVRYYTRPGVPPTQSVFPYGPAAVPWPYGGFYMAAMDSHGGWIASAVDLLKFWNAIDGRRGAPLLKAQTIAEMTARPDLLDWANSSTWYGMGFLVIPKAGGADWWHDGSMPGTRAWVVRTYDGDAWAALFNSGTPDEIDAQFSSDLDQGLRKAQASVTSWPVSDQFGDFAAQPTPAPSINGQDGVTSAATFRRAIVPGSWVSIFGADLAGSTRSWSEADFNGDALPLTLDGVQVTFNGLPGAISYIAPRQINVQVPAGLMPGAVEVQAIYNGLKSDIAVAPTMNVSPGLFSYRAGTENYAAAVFADGTLVGDPAVLSDTRAPKPGDVISIYGTGFVTSAAGTIIRSPVPLVSQDRVSVSFGSTPATVLYAGLIGAGLFQVNIVTPALARGDYVITVTVDGATSPPSAVLPVRH